MQIPVPVHWLSAVQCVPALLPPRQVPPTSQSSPVSTVPLPQPPVVGVGVGPPHTPLTRALTPRMINATLTCAGQVTSAGTPSTHDEHWPEPKTMFTSLMRSSTVTAPLPLQSPAQWKAPYAGRESDPK